MKNWVVTLAFYFYMNQQIWLFFRKLQETKHEVGMIKTAFGLGQAPKNGFDFSKFYPSISGGG